jgi:hypothetical protein
MEMKIELVEIMALPARGHYFADDGYATLAHYYHST